MDGIRQWAVAVCAAAVVCTLLRHLFPDSRLGQQGRMLLPCLFLCVLLSPISGFSQGVKLPDFTHENGVEDGEMTVRMRQQVVAQVNTTLLQMVNQSLSGYGWSAKKVVADMDISEDGSIRMGQITVYVDEEVARRATAVKQVAEKRLGATVEVAVWQGADG
ncbi:MAG: hypothetical protein IKA50_03895 [Clostridia bacterium]|nr:hypothetical protein [Clostridia bacterium]